MATFVVTKKRYNYTAHACGAEDVEIQAEGVYLPENGTMYLKDAQGDEVAAFGAGEWISVVKRQK